MHIIKSIENWKTANPHKSIEQRESLFSELIFLQTTYVYWVDRAHRDLSTYKKIIKNVYVVWEEMHFPCKLTKNVYISNHLYRTYGKISFFSFFWKMRSFHFFFKNGTVLVPYRIVIRFFFKIQTEKWNI